MCSCGDKLVQKKKRTKPNLLEIQKPFGLLTFYICLHVLLSHVGLSSASINQCSIDASGGRTSPGGLPEKMTLGIKKLFLLQPESAVLEISQGTLFRLSCQPMITEY